MHRFFVPADWIAGRRARLEGRVARQITRVLRMGPGDQVVLLDGSGAEYVTRLDRFSAAAIEGEVVSRRQGKGEPRVQLVLYQALLKGDRFEWVLQKGTELGVSAFAPVTTLRSVPRERQSWPSTHYVRWQRVIAEAAEQSGRSVLPELQAPLAFAAACQQSRGSGLSIIPWEGERHCSLRSALEERTAERVNVFIGPEGGWAEEEVAHARSCGIVPASLGRRVLRAETAAIATVTAVMYALGELEGPAHGSTGLPKGSP